MKKGNYVKKKRKYFDNFMKEEQWLQQMLQDGWILQEYTNDNPIEYGSKYLFTRVHTEDEKKGTYKIDFHSFSTKEEFDEYTSLFEDAGWKALTRHQKHTKHIFYTNLPDARKDIFSDIESYIEREERKIASSLKHVKISIGVTFITFLLGIILTITNYNSMRFSQIAWAVLIVFSFYTMPAYTSYKGHKKAYTVLMNQQA
jgi:hypothetical protein